MTKTWICADHHFGHANIITFVDAAGNRTRPFASIEEHDETLIANHNKLVDPKDRVYVLGDLAMGRRHVQQVSRLNGRKVLVKGNHDIFDLKDYTPYFDDVRAYVVKKFDDHKVIMSHMPVHPDCVGKSGINIHGHLHQNSIDDPRYGCVSLEHTEFSPIEFEQICKTCTV